MIIAGIEPVFGKKNRLRVRLLGGTDFILYKGEIERYGLLEGEDISEEDYGAILQDIFIPRARSRALHLLVQQDRSKAQLRKKLLESGYPTEAVDIAISYVSEYGYIDDIRYVQGYIRSHRERRSKRRILYDLENKGIEKSVIKEAIRMIKEEDLEVFCDMQIIINEIKKTSLEDEKDRKKLYERLIRKGFKSSDILQHLKNN